MPAEDRSLPLERFHRASARIDALIEATPTPTNSSREAVRERAELRMARLARFLQRLGNPQNGYAIVHVGGTSGKGSTSTTIAAILTSAGLVTGLHTSPYLQSPTEKLQVDGTLISAGMFADLADALLEAHDDWLRSGEDSLTYGEAWMALTMLFFRANRVDVAVLEVGAGGRFDLTNIVSPVVSVITSVGIDHTATLGGTIAEIAWHKAGIIKPGVPAVTGVTNTEALAIIRDEARLANAPLEIVDPDLAAVDVVTDSNGTTWTDGRTGKRHRASLRGSFQARNGAVALAATGALRRQGVAISDGAIAHGLRTARIPGRVELIEDRCPVMLDGAHNAEKVAALAEDVPHLLPVGATGRRIGVLGLLEAKQAAGMLGSIVPVIDVLVATSPQVVAKEVRDAEGIAEVARAAGFRGEIVVEPDPARAMDVALGMADPGREDAVLVTGSLYLVGNIRERWFRTGDILLAQSPWPVRVS